MNIDKHPIYKAIYELCREIEKLPASEQQTKVVIMASSLEKPADKILSEYDSLLASHERLRVALKSIKANDKDSKYGEGICPYGCDCPNIAQTALAAIPAEFRGGKANERD